MLSMLIWEKDAYTSNIWENGHKDALVFKKEHQDLILTIISFDSVIRKLTLKIFN